MLLAGQRVPRASYHARLPVARRAVVRVHCVHRRKLDDPGAHSQAKAVDAAKKSRRTYDGVLQHAAQECGISANGLADACKSAIVRDKHPGLLRRLRTGNSTEAGAYLKRCQADGEHLYLLLLSQVSRYCDTPCCPEIKDPEARKKFVVDLLQRYPVLFLVPAADVFNMVYQAEQLFQVISRIKLLRALAVCLSQDHVTVTQQRLARQVQALKAHMPDLSHEQLTSMFLSNPLGLLKVDAVAFAKSRDALAQALDVSPSQALQLELGNSSAMRMLTNATTSTRGAQQAAAIAATSQHPHQQLKKAAWAASVSLGRAASTAAKQLTAGTAAVAAAAADAVASAAAAMSPSPGRRGAALVAHAHQQATAPQAVLKDAVEQTQFVKRYRFLQDAVHEAAEKGNPKWAERLQRARASSLSSLLCYSWPRYLRVRYLLTTDQHARVALASAITYSDKVFMKRFPCYQAWVEATYGSPYDEVCAQLNASVRAGPGLGQGRGRQRAPVALQQRMQRSIRERQEGLHIALELAPKSSLRV